MDAVPAAAHGALAEHGEDQGEAARRKRELQLPEPQALLVARAALSRRGRQGAPSNQGRAPSDHATHVAQPRRARRGAERVHPWRPELLSPCQPANAQQARSLRRRTHRAMVVAKAFAATACMVARAEGSALAPTWAGAVEPPATSPTRRLKARNVNAGGSRMREIRTYGLTRGCWP